MHLVADANMPLAKEAFSQFGEVTLLPGRDLTRQDLLKADALLVRSVTKVNADLLADTPVRFVGTATIGTDHLDIPWLESQGIRWTSAAGCNARSVVEWVVAAMIEYSLASGNLPLDKLTLGIVGHGNIGSRLAPVARALGMRVLVNDPPLARAGKLNDTVDLKTIMTESDIVTLHVPLNKEGQDVTHHLISHDELELMKPQAALINASRGPVLDNQAALTYAKADQVTFLLDVFENEPRPNRDLVKFALIATPHIAGYSFEGKINGTRMMAEALGDFLGTPSQWTPQLPPPSNPIISVTAKSPLLALQQAVRASYPIRTDNNHLREGLDLESEAGWGQHFDQRRKVYPQRREFSNYQLDLAPEAGISSTVLKSLGFTRI
jgi:erythronate-4-phosphate dehydrogenase